MMQDKFVLAPPACADCGAENEPDANFCVSCRALLRPVWVCWACAEVNAAEAPACAGCARPPDTPRVERLRRRLDVAGMALLGVAAVLVAALVAWDLANDRHVLSTKDGRLQKEVQAGHVDR